jgi:hypothetical protein
MDRHQRRRNPGEELNGPDHGLTEHRRHQNAQPQQYGPGRMHRQ